MKFEIKEKELLILVDSDIYNEDVLHKCFYWYGRSYNIDINKISDNQIEIRLLHKNAQSISENVDELIEKVKRDLIDFKLRDIVAKETKSVRELIVSKAFAYYGLDENPLTDISDPVGFDPDNIKNG